MTNIITKISWNFFKPSTKMLALWQWWTNSLKVYEPPQNSWCQKRDTKQVPSWAFTNIRHHSTQFSRHATWCPESVHAYLITLFCKCCLILPSGVLLFHRRLTRLGSPLLHSRRPLPNLIMPAPGSGVLGDPAWGCPCWLCGAGDPHTVNVKTRI
jgi:hypothetical protein